MLSLYLKFSSRNLPAQANKFRIWDQTAPSGTGQSTDIPVYRDSNAPYIRFWHDFPLTPGTKIPVAPFMSGVSGYLQIIEVKPDGAIVFDPVDLPRRMRVEAGYAKGHRVPKWQ